MHFPQSNVLLQLSDHFPQFFSNSSHVVGRHPDTQFPSLQTVSFGHLIVVLYPRSPMQKYSSTSERLMQLSTFFTRSPSLPVSIIPPFARGFFPLICSESISVSV